MEEACPYKKVPCPNGCDVADMSRPKMQQHVARKCPLRLVECKWGCGVETLLAEDQDKHEQEECLQGVVPCPNKCAVRNLRRCKVVVHVVNCPERPMPCPLGGLCSVPHSQLKVAKTACSTLAARLMLCLLCSRSTLYATARSESFGVSGDARRRVCWPSTRKSTKPHLLCAPTGRLCADLGVACLHLGAPSSTTRNASAGKRSSNAHWMAAPKQSTRESRCCRSTWMSAGSEK